MLRDPFPIHLESGAMPANYGLGLHNRERGVPAAPKLAHDDPKQLVGCREMRTRLLARENGELLPKCQVFQKQATTRADRSNKQKEQEPQRAEHVWVISKCALRKISWNAGRRSDHRGHRTSHYSPINFNFLAHSTGTLTTIRGLPFSRVRFDRVAASK